MATEPILRFSNGTDVVDILAPGSGWKMADPYWNPQIAQYKSGGIKINSALAEGQRLVHKEYDNVVETIPLSLSGTDQDRALKTLSDLLKLSRQSSDYWTESYEFDDVWMEARVACSSCYSGYARIVQMKIPELTNPYGQPFFGPFNQAVMEGLSLIVEREPLWRAIPPGEIIGPLYNLIDNPDFELWNFGVTDSQPDSWNDLETIQITGTNNRESSSPHSGSYSLRVRVSGSTLTGRIKGVTQTIADTKPNTTYTVVAWVRNDGVSNGVGRLLVTYSGQLQVYRSNSRHGWTLYTGTFTTGVNDVVAINCEILSTAANTDGTVYFDSLMLLEGDWEQEAIDGVLPYLSGSHVDNHWDLPESGIVQAGNLNYLDVWNVPGNEDALVKMIIMNNTTPASLNSPVTFATIRAGMRRTKDVLNFTNFFDPIGIADTTASSNSKIDTGALSSDWKTVATYMINDSKLIENTLGKFRVLCRVYDTAALPDLEVRLQFWIGQAGTNIKTLTSYTVPIVNNWCIVDLTQNAALDWNQRITPSGLGFEIQMRRGTGTSKAYLDYTLALPTDGGVLYATVNPAVVQNSALVVDNTASSYVYGARLVRSKLFSVYQTDTPLSRSVEYAKDYKGVLYFSTLDGELYSFTDNVGTLKFNYGTNIMPLEVYNERLYVMSNTGSPSRAYSSDGSVFPGGIDFTYGASIIARAAKAFNGLLYVLGDTGTLAPIVLYSWNGTTSTLLMSSAGYTQANVMEVFKNKLYLGVVAAGTGQARILEYNPANGVVTDQGITGGITVFSALKVFNGKLYATLQGTNTLFVFDGVSWTSSNVLATLTPRLDAMEVVRDTLYIGGWTSGPVIPVIISTTDGATFSIVYRQPTITTMQQGQTLKLSNGRLFFGVRASPGNPGLLLVVDLSETQYKVSDYQLVEFMSPPTIRHRYFFSFDREEYINNLDDTALVGIGFVPRYLTLRGKF